MPNALYFTNHGPIGKDLYVYACKTSNPPIRTYSLNSIIKESTMHILADYIITIQGLSLPS